MQLSFRGHRFTPADFDAVVREASGLGERERLPAQVRYLLAYLRDPELDARWLLVERPYVDRHFLKEYQGYYSTTLRNIPRHVTRLHVFSGDEDPALLPSRLAEAIEPDARQDIQRDLQDRYIGFILLRPLPWAPVGRTVLRPYAGASARCFGPHPPPHRVHLYGLTLKAHGVQFHQQDQAVGACATAAVWCALAAVMRRDGGRSPTPIAVTQRAISSLPTSRALPAVSGLTLEQMAGAINAFGYSPDLFKPNGRHAEFQLQLMTYVRSGIPVILQVWDEEAVEGHAVTVVGFRVSDDLYEAAALESPVSDSRSLWAKGMTRVYVNDDRLGPYARMIWEEEVAPEEEGVTELALVFHGQEGDDDLGQGRMRIWNAIAPLYPKIRLRALDLLGIAHEAWPLVEHLAGPERRDSLLLETFFMLGGDYQSGLYALALSPGRAAAIAGSVLLSRYVGVLRVSLKDQWFMDVICDATDLNQDTQPLGSVLALITSEELVSEPSKRTVTAMYPHILAP